jgi:ABC-type transport system substrate-binding protein
MKHIKEIIKEKGCKSSDFWIVLLHRVGDRALYLNKSGGYFAGFEIHKIRIRKAGTYTIEGRTFTVSNRESIAKTSEFGYYAYHYPKLEKIFELYPEFRPYELEIRQRVSEEIKNCC